MVAARITLAATPIVPLIRMFHIAHRPSTDRERPSTSIRSPWPTNGRNTANSTNGTSITRRLATNADREIGELGEHHQHHDVDAERPERLAGRGDDGEHEQHLRQQACTPAGAGGSGCRRGRRARGRPLTVRSRTRRSPPRHRARHPSALRRPTTTKSRRPMPKVTATPMMPASPVDRPSSSTPFDAVVGERAVGRGVVRLGVVEALVDRDLVEPVGRAAREPAHDEGQPERHEEPTRPRPPSVVGSLRGHHGLPATIEGSRSCRVGSRSWAP